MRPSSHRVSFVVGVLLCAACGDDDAPADAGARDSQAMLDASVDCGAPDPMPGPGFFACGGTWCETGAEFCCNAASAALTCSGLECRTWGSPTDDCQGFALDCNPGIVDCPGSQLCCHDGETLRCQSACSGTIWCDEPTTDCPSSLPFCCAELEEPRSCRADSC